MSTITAALPTFVSPTDGSSDIDGTVGGKGLDGTQTSIPDIREGMQTVIRQIIENMTSTQTSTGGMPKTQADAPALKPPLGDARASLTYLLGRLTELFSDSSLSDIQNRLKQSQLEAASRQALAEQSQAEFDQAVAAATHALDALDQAAQHLADAEQALANAQDTLASAKAALDGATPGTPEYDAATQAYEAAKSSYDAAKSKHDDAKREVTQAFDAAKEATRKADDILGKFLGNQLPGTLDKASIEKNGENMDELILLMAKLAKLLGDSANDAIQEDMKFFEAIRKARQADLVRQNEEYEAKVKQAQKLSNIFGIFGKILGAVLAVVGVVGAVFTGGLSTTMTVVGVALLADSVMGAATGFSLVGEAIKPLMTHVIQPLASEIGKFVGSMLQELGVGKDTAEMIGNVVGVVAAAAVAIAFIAVSVVAGGAAAATNFGKMLGTLVSDFVKKMVPDMLREAGKAGAKMVAQGMSSAASRLGVKEGNEQMLANTLRSVVTFGELALGGTQAAGNAATGTYQKQATDVMADMMVAQDTLDKITDSVKQSADRFGAAQTVVSAIISQMSDAAKVQQEARKFVLNNVRA
ncbi:type III secretion system translocon subunit SctE [Pandoraea commovens]|uniref:Cell invasion protein SipB n=1 Tax=Pandoraea commovens TaxID=2508289 RepID=A0A5E4U0Z6_9BURK|nr:type III secretion system translocon subunit SctE [Pandoraea commovens]VVD93203.1 Cell invasion protein SipB [Pandoraea commovens]